MWGEEDKGMSADNWRPCPQCVAQAESDAQSARAAADAAYGARPLDEFDALRAKAQRLADAASDAREGSSSESLTLREDYSIGTSADGRFYVHYTGRCVSCGYGVSFEHAQEFPPAKPAAKRRKGER